MAKFVLGWLRRFDMFSARQDIDIARTTPEYAAMTETSNTPLQKLTVNKKTRAARLGQRPVLLWFTGLSAAGKSTLANRIEEKLHDQGLLSYLLDGDNIRNGLSRDLGFSDEDRVENIRRMGEVAKLMLDAGLIVLVAAISPFRSDRQMVRELVEDGEFVEVFVDADLATCEARDPKGLYARARKGEIKNFTGIDSAYETPLNPELRIDTAALDPDAAADIVIDFLRKV